MSKAKIPQCSHRFLRGLTAAPQFLTDTFPLEDVQLFEPFIPLDFQSSKGIEQLLFGRHRISPSAKMEAMLPLDLGASLPI